ncbi:MAG: hypothetical protein AAFY11_10545 [Cyanobacteria bacterium J06641_5]
MNEPTAELTFNSADELIGALMERYSISKSLVYDMKKVVAGFFPSDKMTKAMTAEHLEIMDELNEHRLGGNPLDTFAPVSLAIADFDSEIAPEPEPERKLIDLVEQLGIGGEAKEADADEVDAIIDAAAAMAVGQEASIQELAAAFRRNPELMPQQYREALAQAKKLTIVAKDPMEHANGYLTAVANRLTAA